MTTVFEEIEIDKLYDAELNSQNSSDEIAQLKAQIAMLEESNENWKEGYEKLKDDAKRYWFIRSANKDFNTLFEENGFGGLSLKTYLNLDDAIDAAMKEVKT